MKCMRTLFTILMMTMLLMISASAWAAPPEDGVYEKKDETGKVVAKMYVVTLRGKGMAGSGQLTMESAGGAPYITLEAYDGNGNVTETLATTYIWKTHTAGAGETGIRLTGENLRNSMEMGKKFTPERFSTSFGEQVGFQFLDEGEAHVYRCSPALDGTYIRYDDYTGWYPLAMFLYAYEHSYNMKSFYEKELSSNTYTISNLGDTSYFGDYYYATVSNPAKKDMWEVVAEKNMRIVMECHQHDYQFLFVKDGYHGDPSWVGITWSTFTGTAHPAINALWLHRHMTIHEPDMLEDPNTYVRMTDFYCGEGEGAVTTNVMAVLQNKNNELVKLGQASVSDRGGEIRFHKMMGRATIKGDGVRIRQAPNTNCAILGEKDNGYPLTVLGYVQQTGEKYLAFTWAKVRLDDGTEGYVSGQLIQGLEAY